MMANPGLEDAEDIIFILLDDDTEVDNEDTAPNIDTNIGDAIYL